MWSFIRRFHFPRSFVTCENTLGRRCFERSSAIIISDGGGGSIYRPSISRFELNIRSPEVQRDSQRELDSSNLPATRANETACQNQFPAKPGEQNSFVCIIKSLSSQDVARNEFSWFNFQKSLIFFWRREEIQGKSHADVFTCQKWHVQIVFAWLYPHWETSIRRIHPSVL